MNRPLTIPTHRRPTLPGDILLREFLQPLGITQSAFAKHIGVTNARLSEIIHGKRPVTMDSALRFERALGFSAESWMRMQMTVDMYDALHGRIGKTVDRIKPIAQAS
ncbi:MAG TPA: HigA family addiction module antitoxin [Verrucomicrobiae bacterium]|jgi:addiction module HigA family antidote|nr:HigA family addiction module antitoxin [Verrucomicrobiae bacterium]